MGNVTIPEYGVLYAFTVAVEESLEPCLKRAQVFPLQFSYRPDDGSGTNEVRPQLAFPYGKNWI